MNGSPIQSQMSLLLEYPFPRKLVVTLLKKNMAEAATRDIAALCFRAQPDREKLLSNSLLLRAINKRHRFIGTTNLKKTEKGAKDQNAHKRSLFCS